MTTHGETLSTITTPTKPVTAGPRLRELTYRYQPKHAPDGQPIKLFNYGDMRRDFTYVDDVTEAVVRLIDHAPVGQAKAPDAAPDPGTSAAPWRIFNVGNNHPEHLSKVVALREKEFGRTAQKEMLPMQPGDVPATYADVDDLMREVGFRPSTSIEDGIARFAAWFRDYHGL